MLIIRPCASDRTPSWPPHFVPGGSTGRRQSFRLRCEQLSPASSRWTPRPWPTSAIDQDPLASCQSSTECLRSNAVQRGPSSGIAIRSDPSPTLRHPECGTRWQIPLLATCTRRWSSGFGRHEICHARQFVGSFWTYLCRLQTMRGAACLTQRVVNAAGSQMIPSRRRTFQ